MGKSSTLSPQQKRLAAYLDGLAQAAGHADRIDPLKSYCKGLLLAGERKSVEPMAARLAPDNVRRMHQSLHHLVADAPWSDEEMLAQMRSSVLPAMQHQGPIVAWIVDDTGFPKKGTHSVGVARQYCGQLGKQDNCQVAVSLSVANRPFRAGVTQLGLQYAVGVQSSMTVWEPGAKPWKGQGPPPQLPRRDSQHQPVSVKELAQALPVSAWKNVTWREGTERNLRSRFAAVRVRPAGGDNQKAEPSAEEWLLIEWPRGEAEPAKYWLSTLPSHTKLKPLVKAAAN